MHLSRRLRSTALIFFIYIVLVPLSSARFHEIRHKRQNGARMYLPESFIIPGDEGDPGDWSEWSSPSECSRSCGGGVSYQTRECLRIESNGAALCSGGNRKYFSCNTQDCPEEEPDFRSQQCSRFDKVPFDGVYYNWVPYTNAPNPCELNCMPVGERFYFHQKEKVIDGTRCNDKDLDVCVDGLCQPVGCDMMLGSDAKEDKCRKCGGDGSTCKTISDTLTTNNLAAGYNDILLIPSGATNIRIQETAPSNNYLACRNLSSHYYLNGNWRIDFPRPMFYAGSWWNYQRKPTGFAAPDYLTCSGPITESIYIVMLVQDRNVSINYEYSIPTSVIQNTPDVYSWTHMEFEPCSASCGGGTQTRTVTCNNRMSLGEVDPSLCDLKVKPAETQECGQEPCAPSWIEGEWGKCSKGCGEDGFQNRMVTCERISPNGEQTVEEDAVCLQLAGNKPATTMECNRDVKNCPKYHLGPWKPCDKLCGEGKQVRKVTCYIEENGRKKILPESECVEEKPETEKSCMLTPCEGVDWIISQWSGCDACGQNVETRTAICGSKSGKVYSEEFCGPEVPLLSRPCKSPKCPTQWFSSEWSKCSAACGKGVKSRVVLCGIFNGQSITTASNESECDALSKPESEQECEGEEKECPGEWFTGPWGVCSEPCGGGERVREVLCLANGTKSSNCDQTKLQFASEKCNTHACSDDEVIPVDSTAKPLESEDDDDDECDEDTSEFDVEFVTDKLSADLKIPEGISLDDETTTSSSLITDELMLSDAPSSDETELDESSTDITLSTIEGSGESTDSTDLTSLGISEGSGDETDETTEFSDSTAGSSIDSVTSASTTSIEAVSSSSTEFSTGLTKESEATSSSTVGADASTKSTDVSETSEESSQTTSKYSTTDALSTTETSEKTSETTNEDSTTDLISTDVSSESTVKLTDITGVSDSTTGLSVTEVTESTLMFSGSTEMSSESTSSDSSLSTDDTTLENTKSTDLFTTDASSSSESSTDDLTSETSDSTLVSSESTASSSSDTSKSTEADTSESTDTSVSTESDTTESTDTLSTDTTSSTESDTTESSDTSSTDTTSSTESDTTESTDTSSTDTTSSTESDTTESTDTSSTDTSLSTKSDTTEITTDVTSSTSSDLSSDLTTDGTSSIESSTSSSSETSEVSPVSSTSSGTTQVSDETTPSNTVSTDLSTESSYGTTLSSSSIDTDSTDETTESPKTDTTDVSESSDATTISSSVESDSTEQIITSSSDATDTTDISEMTPSSSASSTEAITTDIASSQSTSVTDTTTLTTSSGDLSEQTTDLSESTIDLSKLMTDSSTGASDSLTESSKLTTDSSQSTTEILESSSISSDLTTDSSYLTTDSSDQTTDSSDLTSDSSDLTTVSSDLTTVSSETTESSTIGLTTVSSSSSDLSLSTDETTVDFWSSTNTDEIEETSEKSTPNTLQSVITKETKLRKCKAKKTKKNCNKKQFGCCPDKVTAAKGPFDEGCPVVKTCAETEFGCCLDGVSPAQDKQLKGCPSSQCAETLFGCCPDKFTPAEGEDNEGCPEPTTLPPTTTNEEITDISTDTTESAETTDSTTVESEDTSTETTTEQEEFVKSCSFAEFGCCPDGKTEAKGDNFMGCDSVNVDSKDCSKSIHGCCHDGRTFATGPDGQGCASCTREPFGCCQDNQTPAHGPLGEGCCLNSVFGCCPDNINFAYGTNFEGCDCTHTPYGCCPDKKQAARGYNNEGCSCETLKFGCCPDKITPATGPKFEGCACHTMQYGCCPDGTTLAQGPHHYGCHCSQSKFKCCQDEKTSAKGPDYEGCSCLESKFGCCPDGVTSAQGEKFEGCENVKEPPQKACGLPKEAGNCTSFAIKHYFDTEYGACNRFWYGGCGGNDNKFETEAHCKATCQDYKGKEACLLPKSSGPCTAYNKKWYFNSDRNRCEEFNYGGCYGTSNRFDSIEECQALCTVSESIPPCEQPVDEGPCEGNFERWFYDNVTDVCQPFRYGGCKGNKNNYPTEHSCNYNCRQPGVHKDPEESNERTNEVIPNRCESYESECQQLRCQYGVQRTTVEDNCTRCGCINPCEQHSCPEGQQCAVDITSDTSRQFEPVCRSVNKPGECPILTSSSTNCARECYTDADCRGDNKCCGDGCGFVCVRPTVPTQATIRPTTPLPAVIYPGEVKVSLEPKKQQELDVQTAAGGIAVLRCFATGIPAPNVTWSRHNVVIDTNQGRYVLTSSGDLTIVQVRQTDTGSYVCIADNGLGVPVQREVKLQVTEPQQTPAYIFGNKNFTQIVTLNSRALVRCPAGGHPAPQVSWWRNKKRLGLIDKRFEMTRDYALMFHAVQLSDLGVYTCEAYNHRQRPVSMKITLKAVGPARAVNRNDVPFLKYVIDPATAPITPRPIYPYRPTRPYAPPPPPVVIQQPQLVSARAVLLRDPRNTYSLGSTVLLACEVQGYPVPNVVWTKDGVPLSASERIQITADPHRLVINDVITDDTGLYGCTARNSFSYNTSEEKVVIESVIPVHPDCVDNPHFANCYLIVKGNYCTHQYYAKFCCRSCTLAGQLRGAHPNAV